MKITILKERPMSLNSFYSGMHWSGRREEAERVHAMVLLNTPPSYRMFTERVDIMITAYFDKRPYDASNIAGKLYEDGLKGKVIKDDSPKYVRNFTTRSEIDKENPRVEIEIKKV